MFLAKALLVWLVMLAAMAGNGAVREGIFSPRVGAHRANALSVLTGSVVLLLITAIAWRWLGIPSARSAWLVGLLWLALTLAFEFGFMHYVAGASWERLLAEYRVHEGRLWPLVLLTTLLAPIMIGWWRGYPRP